MAEDRRPSSFAMPCLVVAALLLAGTIAFTSFVPTFRCPACREWEPGYVITVTHTGSCEFCGGDDRVTLFNWFNAREWRSYAYRKE
jgi:hypothetical protein